MSVKEIQNHYVKLIHESFPQIPIGKVKLVTHGWDHDVIITDEKIVFRFPKREEYRNSFKRELKLLDYLKDSDIPIPDYIYRASDQTFGGYPILPGQEMWAKDFQSLTSAQREKVAQQLGNFLTVLHNTSLSLAQDMGFRKKEDSSKQDAQSRFEGLQKLVFPKLKADEIAWATKRFEKYLSLEFEYEDVLVHTDFMEEHILFDPSQGNVTGIIDFGDVEIADPMLDFARLWVYGEDFVKEVLGNYDRPFDSYMLERSRYPKSFSGLVHMLEIAQGKVLPLSWEENYAKLRRNMELYPN